MTNASFSKICSLFFLCFIFTLTALGQTSGGILYRGEIWAVNKLYPPRLSSSDIAAISSPLQGLIVYNTTTEKLQAYTGSDWLNVGENSFIALTDSPGVWGTAGQLPAINSETNAFIWVDANAHIHTFVSLSDTPSSFSALDGLKLTRVNADHDAIEFVDSTSISVSGTNISTGTVPVARLPVLVGTDGVADGVAGIVPMPETGDLLKFLCGDGTWKDPTSGTVHLYDIPELPASMATSDNQILVSAAGGTVMLWQTLASLTFSGNQITSGVVGRGYLQQMLGAGSGANGASGAVPQPLSENYLQYLRGDGTWATPAMIPMVGATSGSPGSGGATPDPSAGDQVKFLSGGAVYSLVPFSSVSDLPDAWTAGTDDTDAGSYTAYGDDDATGGSITLYNAASEDDSIDFWLVEADGDFVIKADTAPVFTISPTLEQFAVAAGSYTVTYAHGVTDNRTYTLPDQTGIVAITDPGSAGLVENNGDGTYTVREIVTDTITNDTTTIPTSNAVYDYIDGLELGGGGMTSFTLAGSTGSNQTITNGNTLTIAAGGGIETVGGATDTVTVQLSATLFATAGLMYTNGAGTYSVASVENTTINNDSTNIPTENAVYDYIAGLPSGDAVLEVIDRFIPSEAEYPTSAYATLSFRNNRPIILFPDGAAASSIMFTGWVPSNYDPSTDGLEVEVWYSPSTAESQSFRVEAAVERIVTGGSALDLGTDSFDTGVAITTTAHSGHDDMYVETIPLTSGDVDALAGGEMYRLLIKRDPTHGDDGATATMQVHQVLVKVVSE